MAKWLIKSEPDDFSFDDLTSASETLWDGVSNALALKHLRTMAAGDDVYFYHTGKVRAIVGTAKVVRTEVGDEPRVFLKAGKALQAPVTLAAIKAEPSCATWELVRQSRLSVMPVPAAIRKWIVDASKKGAAE